MITDALATLQSLRAGRYTAVCCANSTVCIRAAYRWHTCRTKERSITYCVCVCVALFIQHAKRMRRAILSSLACLAVPNSSKLSHTRHDFRKQKLLNIECVL